MFDPNSLTLPFNAGIHLNAIYQSEFDCEPDFDLVTMVESKRDEGLYGQLKMGILDWY
jgi:hypothetical protein